MRKLILLGLAIAAPAHADDCKLGDAATGTGATQLAKAMDNIGVPGCETGACPDDVPSPRERHGFFAAGEATAGTIGQASSDGDALTAGALTANARAGWRSGLQVCASTDTIAGTESRGDSQFHVVFPWPFFETVMLGGEQQWQLRPRLDASRIYLRRLYSATQFQAGVGTVAWALRDGGSAIVLPFRVDTLRRDQDRTGATLQTIRFGAFEATHPNSHLEVLPVTITEMHPHGLGTDAAPLPASSSLVRVDGATASGTHGALSYEFALGALFASHPVKLPVAGMLGLGWGPWSARIERAAYLAMDDSLTVEDRISAAYHDGRWRAGAFAALTHTSDQPRAQITGGGSAGVDFTLPEEVKLALDVEVARSYYARLDADPRPTPELAELGTVQLTRTFTYNPTAH